MPGLGCALVVPAVRCLFQASIRKAPVRAQVTLGVFST